MTAPSSSQCFEQGSGRKEELASGGTNLTMGFTILLLGSHFSQHRMSEQHTQAMLFVTNY